MRYGSICFRPRRHLCRRRCRYRFYSRPRCHILQQRRNICLIQTAVHALAAGSFQHLGGNIRAVKYAVCRFQRLRCQSRAASEVKHGSFHRSVLPQKFRRNLRIKPFQRFIIRCGKIVKQLFGVQPVIAAFRRHSADSRQYPPRKNVVRLNFLPVFGNFQCQFGIIRRQPGQCFHNPRCKFLPFRRPLVGIEHQPQRFLIIAEVFQHQRQVIADFRLFRFQCRRGAILFQRLAFASAAVEQGAVVQVCSGNAARNIKTFLIINFRPFQIPACQINVSRS